MCRSNISIRWFTIVLIAAISLLPGCCLLHVYHPVSVVVIDAETKKPVPNAELDLFYMSYMLDLFMPLSFPRYTDGAGRATLWAVPYGFGESVSINVSSENYLFQRAELPKKVISNAYSIPILSSLVGAESDYVIELYTGPRPTIELILPAGYRGPIKVINEAGDGTAPPGQRVFQFPVSATGKVVIKGPKLLLDIHSTDLRARYENGPLLPEYQSKEGVELRWVTCHGNKTSLFVVGSREDEDCVYRLVHRQIDHNSWTSNIEAYESLFAED
ncbi:MAG: hypothetical protein QM703_26275 [Gemmatales bacterium]